MTVTYHEALGTLPAVGMAFAVLVSTLGPLLLGRALAKRNHGYTFDDDAPTEGPSFWAGFDVGTRATLDADTVVLETTHADVTTEWPRVPSESELFFLADPLGSASLPDDLLPPSTSVDVFVELVDAGVLTSSSTAETVSASWVGWGMLLPDDESSSEDVDAELARVIENELVAA